MNKNRGIWIAIVSILVIGIGITWTTNSVISKKSGVTDTAAAAYDAAFSLDTEKMREEEERDSGDPDGSAVTAGPGTVMSRSAGSPTAPEKQLAQKAAGEVNMTSGRMQEERGAQEPETAPDTEETASETAPAPDTAEAAPGAASYAAAASPESGREVQSDTVTGVAITPLEPAAGNPQVYQGLAAGTYDTKRLAEVDAQIKKMRSESSDPNTYTVQALADQELKLWNEELGILYATVYEGLDVEGRAALETSQQTWLKDRDKKAETAARKYSGGSLEGVEYTASMAESTRQRAYDLAGEYAYLLSPSDEG